MYFFISPKNKTILDIQKPVAPQVYASDSKSTVEWANDAPVLVLKHQIPDGSLQYFGGTIEPLLRYTKKYTSIRHLVWTVTNEFPEYLNIEVLFKNILERIFHKIGAFDLYCLPLDKHFHITNQKSLEESSTALSSVYPELYKENDSYIKKVEKNTNIHEVLPVFKALPTPYAIIMSKLYAISLLDGHLLSTDVMDTLVEQVFTRIEDKKWKHMRSFLLYKFMHGARYLRSGFLPYISQRTLTQHYTPLVESCSINLETTQFLINDLIIEGINKAQDGVYRELKEHFMRKVFAFKGVILNFPDLHSFYIAEKTGNSRRAFFTYIRHTKEALPVRKLHRVFDDIIPNAGFIRSYKQTILKQYYNKLPLYEKILYANSIPSTTQNRTSKPKTLPLSQAGVATLAGFLLTGIALRLYLSVVHLQNTFTSLAEKPFSEVITILLGIAFSFGIFTWFVLWGATTCISIIRNSKPGFLTRFLASVGLAIFTGIALGIFTLSANISLSEQQFVGTTNTHIVAGLYWYAFTDIAEISIEIPPCATNTSSCRKTIEMTLNLEEEGRTSRSLTFQEDTLTKTNTSFPACQVIASILEQALAQKIPIQQSERAPYSNFLEKQCGLPPLESKK